MNNCKDTSVLSVEDFEVLKQKHQTLTNHELAERLGKITGIIDYLSDRIGILEESAHLKKTTDFIYEVTKNNIIKKYNNKFFFTYLFHGQSKYRLGIFLKITYNEEKKNFILRCIPNTIHVDNKGDGYAVYENKTDVLEDELSPDHMQEELTEKFNEFKLEVENYIANHGKFEIDVILDSEI